MIWWSRDIDMKYLIINHELTSVLHSLMRRDSTLLNVWEGKSDFAARELGEANVTVFKDIPYKSECIVIDVMYIMNQAVVDQNSE